MHLRNETGFSLIEVSIAVGIAMVLALGLAQLSSQQTRTNKQLLEKVASVDVFRQVSSLTTDKLKCGPIVVAGNLQTPSNYPFNAASVSVSHPKWITLKSIPGANLTLGGSASAVSTSLYLYPAAAGSNPSGIELEVYAPNFANLHLRFDNSKLVQSLREIVIPNIELQTSGPTTSESIVGCGLPPDMVVCLDGCGANWPNTVGIISMYNWSSHDNTTYFASRGSNCNGTPLQITKMPGGGAHSGAISPGSFYFCTR